MPIISDLDWERVKATFHVGSVFGKYMVEAHDDVIRELWGTNVRIRELRVRHVDTLETKTVPVETYFAILENIRLAEKQPNPTNNGSVQTTSEQIGSEGLAR